MLSAQHSFFMILYECWRFRYFKSDKTMADFYSSFCKVPVIGAILPVLLWRSLSWGIYGKVIWLMISSVILGIDYIGIPLRHRNKLRQLNKNKRKTLTANLIAVRVF